MHAIARFVGLDLRSMRPNVKFAILPAAIVQSNAVPRASAATGARRTPAMVRAISSSRQVA